MRGAIHALVIAHRGVGTPDAEGRGGAVTTDTITVMGRMMLKTGKEVPPAGVGRFGESLDAIAAVPAGTPVAAKDQVIVQGVDPTIDGTYEVTFVGYSPILYELNLRLMQ